MEDRGAPEATVKPPQSPGASPVELENCIEELLRFTLASAAEGTLDIDVGLSKEYCSKLLADEPSDSFLYPSGLYEGVPSYPLYKYLANSMYKTISSAGHIRRPIELEMMHEDDFLRQKEDEWTKLVTETGSDLQSILKAVNFELHVQEPFFSLLKGGQKTIEGRCNTGDYNRIESGDLILFNKCLLLQVEDVHRHSSFYEMLKSECLVKVLPGVKTIEEGVQVYRKFYSEEKERSNGVLAICVKRPTFQVYNSMASILTGLSYEGIQCLLNLAHTVGTVPDALPPPASALISSFSLPHKPNIKSSRLTIGARALEKHVNRSINNHWGTICGSDDDKNRLAMDVITNTIARCSWLNLHIVPPHGIVFEIRTAEGYGARWSEDGKKFIGFLEPYMVDGHAKGWKH